MIYLLTYTKKSLLAGILTDRYEYTSVIHDTWEPEKVLDCTNFDSPEVFVVDILASVNSMFKRKNSSSNWNMIDFLEKLANRYPAARFILVENALRRYEHQVAEFFEQLKRTKYFRELSPCFSDGRVVYYSLEGFEEKLQCFTY